MFGVVHNRLAATVTVEGGYGGKRKAEAVDLLASHPCKARYLFLSTMNRRYGYVEAHWPTRVLAGRLKSRPAGHGIGVNTGVRVTAAAGVNS